MRVAINELKAGLSRFVELARSGQVIEVTSHQRPVARIVGIASSDSAGLQRMLVSGAAQWQGGKPQLLLPVVLPGGGKTLGDTILEDRGG